MYISIWIITNTNETLLGFEKTREKLPNFRTHLKTIAWLTFFDENTKDVKYDYTRNLAKDQNH